MREEDLHGSLPWFVNGTLGRDEAAAFERHLAGCEACRKEMAFLKKLRAELDRHGEAFLEEHPSAERVAALLDPALAEEEIPEDEAVALRRHLALCATCAEEARWLRGEESAGPDGAAPARTGKSGYRWVAVAAAVVLAFLAGYLVRPVSPDRGSGVVVQRLVDDARRGTVTEVRVEPAAERIRLIFEVDLAADDFPATLRVSGADGEAILSDDVAAGDVYAGLYVFVELRRSDFPDGSYVARLAGSGAKAGPPGEYPFRIVSVH